MNLAVDLAVILAVWRWGDWKKWRKYHASLLFASVMALLYNVLALSHNYFLWKIEPSFFSYVIEETLHCFILMPGTALLFLTQTQGRNWWKIVVVILKFTFIYSLIELLMYHLGVILYFNGWRYLFSVIFYLVMFGGVLLHFKKPGLSYAAFILTTIAGVLIFDIPL